MNVIKDSEEIDREGGIVTVTDVTGWRMTLTKDEALCFPMAVSYKPWRLIDGYWLDPDEKKKTLALVK